MSPCALVQVDERKASNNSICDGIRALTLFCHVQEAKITLTVQDLFFVNLISAQTNICVGLR